MVKATQNNDALLALLAAVVMTALCFIIWYRHNAVGAARAPGSNYSLPFLLLSCIALFAYFIASLYPMVSFAKSLLFNLKNRVTLKCLLTVTLLFVLVKLAIKWIAAPKMISPLTLWEYLMHIAGQALAYPLNFMISHVIYYGPIVCVLIFFWKSIIRHLAAEGRVAIFILTGISAVLAIGSESRQLINFLPLIVYIVADFLQKKTPSLRFAVAFIFISFCISKVWLPINHGSEWPSLLHNPQELILQFPLQWYFMYHGPWVSQSMFFINAASVIITFSAIFIIIKREKRRKANAI